MEELIDSVKEYLNTHKSMSDASRATMLMEADRAAGLRARLFDVMEEAKKNYEANATEEGAEGKKAHSVNVFGLAPYDAKEEDRLTQNGASSILIAKNKSDIIDYVEKYVGTNSKEKIYLGTIDSNLASRIKKDIGVNVEGYHLSITNAFENSHNDPVEEAKRGQIAITPEMVAEMPQVVTEYDSVEKSTGKNGENALVFKKKIGGNVTAVEYISKGRHSLYLQTMYANKKAAPSEEIRNNSANLLTSKTYTDKASSDSSITSDAEKSTTSFSLKTPVEESGDLIAVHNINKQE